MKYLIFSVSHLFVKYFLSFQLFVFSALWSSQPFELPSFLVSKLFGPPKMSLVLQPQVAWLLILRTGGEMQFDIQIDKKTEMTFVFLISMQVLTSGVAWCSEGVVQVDRSRNRVHAPA